MSATEVPIAKKDAGGIPAEAALFLHAILDASDDAIVSKDLNGVITSWNQGAQRLFGYTPDEAIGKTMAELLVPEERHDEESKILAQLRKGEVVDRLETVRRRKDESLVNVCLTASPVKNGSGNIIGASTIARDITHRIRFERSRLLLGAIVDSSDDAIISKDLNGVVTSWNKSAQRLFGYTAEEAIGRTVAELLIPDDRQDEEPEILARLRRGDRVDHFETVRHRKDGTLLDISLTISPVKDEAGIIIGASKIARDITESKRARQALAESEARFRQLADAMPQMVWTARPDGYVDYYNERWYDFTGFSRDVFGDLSWRSLVHPEHLRATVEAYEGSIQSGQAYNMECQLWDCREDRWRWFVGRALPARDSDKQIVKWFGTFTDIDEQKRVEKDLRRANDSLEQFAFSASHDLQEPLRTIKIYSELLTRRHADHLDPRAVEYMQHLRDAATRMEALVRDLLAYTNATKAETVSESADANRELNAALANLSGAITESNAEIIHNVLPPVTMRPTHLQQVLQNLVGNAIKYRSPDRPPKIYISAERLDNTWVFAVSDNGIGIDPQYKEHIFGLFKRLHRTDEYEGTGIGLAICQRIVDRYHGRIWVESEPGKGSTFRFSVPAQTNLHS